MATVKQAPGFVAGYWIRRRRRHGTSFVVFETQEQAQAASRRPTASPRAWK